MCACVECSVREATRDPTTTHGIVRNTCVLLCRNAIPSCVRARKLFLTVVYYIYPPFLLCSAASCRMLPMCDRTVAAAMVSLLQSHPNRFGMVHKQHVHTRLKNMPICPELTRATLPRTDDVGRFLAITGTVIRATTVKMLEYEREFLCTKCKHIFTVSADFEQCYALSPPARCPGNPGESPCDSSKFKCTQDVTANPTACRDYQEVKIQEQISKLAVGMKTLFLFYLFI